MSLTSYHDALDIVLNASRRELPTETVPLVLAAGRVLAEGVVSQEDIPRFANSAMDGYAVIAADLAAASHDSPATLRVIGESSAGTPFQGRVEPGEAVRIMTGGIMPEGADAVIEVESTKERDRSVAAERPLRVGESVRKAGEDIRNGSEALPAGKRLTPGDIGVLASLGVTNVPVRVRPTIGLLATGNEVIEPFRTPTAGQIRNSSIPALYAYCMEAGGEPIDLGIARDDRDELEDKLEQGLRYDILITTGGVSAGSYDLVQNVLPELGVDLLFHKVNIRPGKPVLFGTYGDGNESTLVFALPGNPVSTLVTFRRFVLPAIRRLLRQREPGFRMHAVLGEPLKKQDGKRHFIRGRLSTGSDGIPVVATTGTQSSGAMSSMSLADCLIIVEEERTAPNAGEVVEIELL